MEERKYAYIGPSKVVYTYPACYLSEGVLHRRVGDAGRLISFASSFRETGKWGTSSFKFMYGL